MLASNIKRARKARGWSQEVVAKKLRVSRVAVTNWENPTDDGNLPSIKNLQRLARIFGVTVDDLLAGRAS